MKIPSISQEELEINEKIITAIIYSMPNSSFYFVELRLQGKSFFIKKNNSTQLFENIENAKSAARLNFAEIFYLALDKTYQEVECENKDFSSKQGVNRYDYIKLD